MCIYSFKYYIHFEILLVIDTYHLAISHVIIFKNDRNN